MLPKIFKTGLVLGLLLGLSLITSLALADCSSKQTDCLINGQMGGPSAGKVWYDRCYSWKHAMCQNCRDGNTIAKQCLQYKVCRENQQEGCWVCFWNNIWHTSMTCYSGPPSGEGVTRQSAAPGGAQ
jgi:hypothetical protein